MVELPAAEQVGDSVLIVGTSGVASCSKLVKLSDESDVQFEALVAVTV